jgi:hypothetical protein
MEEIMQDSVKGLTKGFEALGFNVTDDGVDKLDFGIEPEEMLKRWGAALVGGAIGGATFELFNQMDLVLKPELRKLQKLPAWQRMIYDLQDPENYERYTRALANMTRKGNVANENLSATDYESVKNADGTTSDKRVYKQGSANDNQNKALAGIVKGMIDQTYNVLRTEGLINNSTTLIQLALTNPDTQEKIKQSGLSTSE